MAKDDIEVFEAGIEDAEVVAEMVRRLLLELGGFTSFDVATAAELCRRLMSAGSYTAFLARDAKGEILGVMTLAECSALYVAGQLGWIQELYVAPEARSLGVGERLIGAAEQRGRERQWRRLEVNTPDADTWPRTVAFYRREGFEGGSVHLRKRL